MLELETVMFLAGVSTFLAVDVDTRLPRKPRSRQEMLELEWYVPGRGVGKKSDSNLSVSSRPR